MHCDYQQNYGVITITEYIDPHTGNYITLRLKRVAPIKMPRMQMRITKYIKLILIRDQDELKIGEQKMEETTFTEPEAKKKYSLKTIKAVIKAVNQTLRLKPEDYIIDVLFLDEKAETVDTVMLLTMGDIVEAEQIASLEREINNKFKILTSKYDKQRVNKLQKSNEKSVSTKS